MPGAIIVIGLVLYPYVYLSARTMFQFQSAEFGEAARTLGAGRWTVFWRVSLPMARPALAVGVALVSLETLNDIGASEYLGVRTLTVSIFTTWLNSRQPGRRRAAVLLHAGDRRRPDRDRALRPPQYHGGVFRRKSAADAANPAQRHQGLARPSRRACCRCCSGSSCRCCFCCSRVSAAGCWQNFDMALGRDAFNSIAFATLATLTALALGFATILAWRWRPNPVRFIAMNISQTGYALPGLVLALGLLTPVLAIDNGLNALRRMDRTFAAGLILVGSGAAVVIAYVIRFLAVPTGMIKAGFERIPQDYDDSARAAGAGQTTTMRQIHLPCCGRRCSARSLSCSWIA